MRNFELRNAEKVISHHLMWALTSNGVSARVKWCERSHHMVWDDLERGLMGPTTPILRIQFKGLFIEFGIIAHHILTLFYHRGKHICQLVTFFFFEPFKFSKTKHGARTGSSVWVPVRFGQTVIRICLCCTIFHVTIFLCLADVHEGKGTHFMGELQMGGCTTSRPFSNLESDLYIFKQISRYLIKSVQLY